MSNNYLLLLFFLLCSSSEPILSKTSAAPPTLLKSQLASRQLSLQYSSDDSSLTILFCPQCAGSGPTPLSLQRLASCLQSVVSLLECPVCLETIPPPAFQCCNGHTLCSGCRSLTDRCPVCRVALGPRGRCLLADKLHALFSTTFLQPVSRKQKRSKVIKNYFVLFQGYVLFYLFYFDKSLRVT